jgi:hypothetical protein
MRGGFRAPVSARYFSNFPVGGAETGSISNRPRTDDADRRAHWPDDLCEIVYVDHFGNAMTGVRAAMLPSNARLAAAGQLLERERTFSDRPPGAVFWYENSNGLAENCR